MSDTPDGPEIPTEEPRLTPSLAHATLASPSPEPVVERLSFSGDGREYFQIWIVNVMLSIVTLGIYSPWAKVRRLQYFYRNTRLAGASFDYHGDPIAIFKGRLIGGFLFLSYSLASVTSPFLAAAIAVAIAVAMPWLLSRSFRFRLHNSSYRGLRFRFSGSTASAYWVFLALPVLMVLSLFTLFPFWQQRMKRYQYENASFGQMRFAMDAPVSGFYRVYLAAFGLGVLVFGTLGAIFAGVIGATAIVGGVPGPDDLDVSGPAVIVMAIGVFVGAVVYLVGILALQSFTMARLRNLVTNHTTLGASRFESDLAVRPLLWVMVTNLLATIGTLGLFWPFAQVRLARCLTESLSLRYTGSLDEFVASHSPEEQAVGEEVAEFFDFDIAF
jgi:uncharacterized membrane protein YjgN (DUF898 family)